MKNKTDPVFICQSLLHALHLPKKNKKKRKKGFLFANIGLLFGYFFMKQTLLLVFYLLSSESEFHSFFFFPEIKWA